MTLQVFRGLDNLALTASVVTIGKFDGVHIGHQGLIDELLRTALRYPPAESLVVTFDRDPRALFSPHIPLRPLVSLEQKLELLELQGVQRCLVIAFDAAFAAISAEEFVADVLLGRLNTKALLVGEQFRFGAGGKGNVALLRQLSVGQFAFSTFSQLQAEGRRVSSTWIRELLGKGNVKQAAVLLARPHKCGGVIVHGKKRGRALGFPTANLAEQVAGFVPADGVYVGRILADKSYPAAISVGKNPTFGDLTFSQIEAHALDETVETLDLYDQYVEVEFIDRLRDVEPYDSVDSLKRAICRDIEKCRRYFTSAS